MNGELTNIIAKEDNRTIFKKWYSRGTWVVQLVKCPTLGFGSDHDLMGPELEPGPAPHSKQSLLKTLFHSPPAPPTPHTCSHTLSNK